MEVIQFMKKDISIALSGFLFLLIISVIFSGILGYEKNGILYLTEYPVWEFGISGKIAFAMLFTVLGLMYAYFYKKSDSFFVPWIMHFLGVLKYGVLF